MDPLSTLDLSDRGGASWDEIYRITKNSTKYYMDERMLFTIKERISNKSNEYS